MTSPFYHGRQETTDHLHFIVNYVCEPQPNSFASKRFVKPSPINQMNLVQKEEVASKGWDIWREEGLDCRKQVYIHLHSFLPSSVYVLGLPNFLHCLKSPYMKFGGHPLHWSLFPICKQVNCPLSFHSTHTQKKGGGLCPK
jgi:hypothetical protein